MKIASTYQHAKASSLSATDVFAADLVDRRAV